MSATTGYRKYDRVKVELDAERDLVTMTVTKRLFSTDQYQVVTSTGQHHTINPDQIFSLA